jgi:hypothetical protein
MVLQLLGCLFHRNDVVRRVEYFLSWWVRISANDEFEMLSAFCFARQLRHYLRHKNWDTRTAATQALSAIVENVPSWEPKKDPQSGESVSESETSSLAGACVARAARLGDMYRTRQ